MEPFDLIDDVEPGALDRALGRRPARSAYVELHNLIAAAERPEDFGPDDLLRIGRRHGVDLAHAFETERLALYEGFLAYALARRHGDEEALSAADRETLEHLARSLHLSAEARRPVHGVAFTRAALAAVSDARLSAQERAQLLGLREALGVEAEVAGTAFEILAREQLLLLVARSLADGAVSREEAADIRAASIDLGISLPERVRKLLAPPSPSSRTTR